MYLSQLTRQGFVTVGKRIKQELLHEQFQLFYGEELLDLLECSIEGQHNWLMFIVRKAKKSNSSFTSCINDEIFIRNSSRF
ncbi:TnsD family Tn7-like transposition protein [Bacillus pacificus]